MASKVSIARLSSDGNNSEPYFTCTRDQITVTHTVSGQIVNYSTVLKQNNTTVYTFGTDGPFSINRGTYQHTFMPGVAVLGTLVSKIDYWED